MICLRKSVKQDEKLLMPLLKSDRNMEVLKVRGLITYEPRREKTGLREFRPAPTQTNLYMKKVRSLKFQICEEEKLYYPSSENKGADQLRSY